MGTANEKCRMKKILPEETGAIDFVLRTQALVMIFYINIFTLT